MTGASRGIGRGVAMSLARQGYGLTVTSRSAVDLVALAADLRDVGAPEVVHLPADLADPDAPTKVVELHARTFGSMNSLVVNAGVGTAGSVASFPVDRLHKTLQVNFTSGFLLTQAALPLLRQAAVEDASRAARIVALSSITGAYAEAGLAAYGASKAALMSLVETVNLEESGNGVCATAIAPGYVETDMSAWITDTIPAKTMIRVSDVVAVVDMLLGLSRTASITQVVMTRSGSSGYGA
ncbi:3-oxoacyl-ACP reductase FabG [Nocardioides pyridinolyticus]